MYGMPIDINWPESPMGIAGELTRGVLIAVGGLTGTAIVILLVSFIVSVML